MNVGASASYDPGVTSAPLREGNLVISYTPCLWFDLFDLTQRRKGALRCFED